MILCTPHQRTDHRQMLPLNQRDLPRIAHAGAGVVTGQAGLQARFHGIEFKHRRT